MGLFKNDKQRENAAKYCYDVSKLLVIGAVVAPLIQGQRIFGIVLGLVAVIVFFTLGYIIDYK